MSVIDSYDISQFLFLCDLSNGTSKVSGSYDAYPSCVAFITGASSRATSNAGDDAQRRCLTHATTGSYLRC